MNTLMRRFSLALMSLILFETAATPALPGELARDQGSVFVIYHDEAAPVPVSRERRTTMKGPNWMASVATALAVSLVSSNLCQAKVTNTAALFQSAVQLGGVEAWFRIPDRGQLAGLGGEAAMRQTLSGSAQSFDSAFSRPPGVRVPDSFTPGDLSAWRQGLERFAPSGVG